MSIDLGIWGWTGDIGHLGYTVTFSLGLAPEDVLTQYGADASQARPLTQAEAWADAWAQEMRDPGGTQLRAGTLGRRGFCFEVAGAEGMKTRTLSRLSAETETIAFYTNAGTSSFLYLKDSQGIEGFEPGRPETLRGDAPHKFWDATQRIVERPGHATPDQPAHATLQVIAKYIRGLLDRSLLEGTLLTGYLAEADRAPLDGPVEAPVETPAGLRVPPIVVRPPVTIDTRAATSDTAGYLRGAARAS
jgi:hypothetical protein